VRRTASEKMEIIRPVDGTDLPARQTLRQLGVPRSTFYGWYQRYLDEGFDGLHDRKPAARGRWNRIPERVQKEVLDLALERTDLSPRETKVHAATSRILIPLNGSVIRVLRVMGRAGCRATRHAQ